MSEGPGQRAVISDPKCRWSQVSRGVGQGLDARDRPCSTCSAVTWAVGLVPPQQLADDVKSRGVTEARDGCATSQRDLQRWEMEG